MEPYTWATEQPHANNEETMRDYLDNHFPEGFTLLFVDGTYAEIGSMTTHTIWGVHAGGNGDFNNHKVTFEFIL